MKDLLEILLAIIIAIIVTLPTLRRDGVWDLDFNVVGFAVLEFVLTFILSYLLISLII